MDRFWGNHGEPLLYEGERIIVQADGVKIGETSKGDAKLKKLKQGTFYVTNIRIIFISLVNKKAKLVGEKYDGLSIFYSDISNAERVGPGGRSLKVECVYKTLKVVKKVAARIYFKSIPSDIADEVVKRVTEVQRERVNDIKLEVHKEEESVKASKKVETKPKPEVEVPPDIQYMIHELGEDEIEVQCPKCGALVIYKPGLDVCPVCKKKVKFFAE